MFTVPRNRHRRRQMKILGGFIIIAIVYAKTVNYWVQSYKEITNAKKAERITTTQNNNELAKHDNELAKHDIKYILIWTPGITPLDCLKTGQSSFFTNDCEYTNCFLTRNRAYLEDETHFDAILFSIAALSNLKMDFPQFRNPKQKYVAVSREPSQKYPALNPFVEDFFNWTWTYRLNSDILWRYFKVFDFQGNDVGPKEKVKWVFINDSISEDIQDKLFQKSKLVAWIVPDCSQKYRWSTYINALQKSLYKYKLTIDIYSRNNQSCGKSCGNHTACERLIESDYFFYLALETYFDKDYVTDVLLYALKNYAIPIVLAGDMYKRFMPPGSYIDASKVNTGALAHQMKSITEDFELHQNYFKWTNNYMFEALPREAEICNLCTILNDKRKVAKISTYKEFRHWWNGKPVQNINDMIMSIFLRDSKMLNLIIQKKYTKLLEVFHTSYIEQMKMYNSMKYETKVDWMFNLTFMTTDVNTADVKDLNDTTPYIYDD